MPLSEEVLRILREAYPDRWGGIRETLNARVHADFANVGRALDDVSRALRAVGVEDAEAVIARLERRLLGPFQDGASRGAIDGYALAVSGVVVLRTDRSGFELVTGLDVGGIELYRVSAPPGGVTDVLLGPDGENAIVATRDARVFEVQMRTGRKRELASNLGGKALIAGALEGFAIAGSNRDFVQLFEWGHRSSDRSPAEPYTCRELPALRIEHGHEAEFFGVTAFALSLDATRLAVADDGESEDVGMVTKRLSPGSLRVYDLATRAQIARIDAEEKQLVFSADGSLLLTAGAVRRSSDLAPLPFAPPAWDAAVAIPGTRHVAMYDGKRLIAWDLDGGREVFDFADALQEDASVLTGSGCLACDAKRRTILATIGHQLRVWSPRPW